MTEARYLLSIVGQLDPTDMIMIDLEKGNGDLSNWALTELQYLEQNTYRLPYFYSGFWFMEPHNLFVPALARYPLALADYQPTEPAPPLPWTKIAMWQKSSTGHITGISGNVDQDILFP